MRKSKHIGYLHRLCNTASHISANVDGPVRRRHAKLLMLYAKLDDQYDQLVMMVVSTIDRTWLCLPSSPGVVNNRLTTVGCLSHSVTVDVDVQWCNFLSPELSG